MKDIYRQAVLAHIEAGKSPDEIIRGLKAVLAARGHEALLPSILRSVLRVLEASKHDGPTVVVAKDKDLQTFRRAIENALAELQAGSPRTMIDPTIIGGFIAKAADRIIDHSYKRSLVRLYRRLTTTN